MKHLLALIALAAGLVAASAQEYVTKNASGSSSATVTFEGRDNPLRITGVDVTSDKAGSLLAFIYGTTNVTVMKPASSTVSNALVTGTLASNSVCLVQTSNGTTFTRTLSAFVQTPVTNQVITVNNALGTNCAIGDPVYQRLAAFATQLTPSSSNDIRFFLTSTNGISQGDRVSTHAAGTRYVAVVTNAQLVTNYSIPTLGILNDVAYGDLVYALVTNNVLAAGATAAGGTNLYVTSTNGWTTNTPILIQNADGRRAVRRIITFASGTNIVISQPVLPFALTNNDSLTRLTTVATNMLPANAGAQALVLNAPNLLTAGTNLVIAATNVEPLFGRVLSGPTAYPLCTMDLTTALPVPLVAGSTWHKLTNTWNLSAAATNTDFTLTVSNSTPPAPGANLLLCPATGGAFPLAVRTTNAVILQSLRFTAAHGVGLNPGDVIWSVSSNTTPVGAASLRVQGNVFSVGAKRPVQVLIDGTSACSLNNITARYE